jgi:hypothetical protein
VYNKAYLRGEYMKTSYKALIAAGAALPLIGLAGVAAHAATDTSTSDSFAAKLATRFNLNKADVTKFLSDEHASRQADRQANMATTLKVAGLSDAQITALQAKRDEQRGAHDAWETANPNATEAEEKAQRNTDKVAFESWAKDQGIDLTKVQTALKESGMGHMGERGRHGRMGMMNDGDKETADDSAAKTN